MLITFAELHFVTIRVIRFNSLLISFAELRFVSIRIFEEIYTLNRTRNEQILLQVKEINATLNAADISPIYLKGTGNLIDGQVVSRVSGILI